MVRVATFSSTWSESIKSGDGDGNLFPFLVAVLDTTAMSRWQHVYNNLGW